MLWIPRIKQTNPNLCEMYVCCEISLMEKFRKYVRMIPSSYEFSLQNAKKIFGKWPILLICLKKEKRTYASVEYCKDMSPVKSRYSADGGKESASKQDTFKLHSKDDTKDDSTLSSESDDCRRKKRKRKRKKIKKKRRHHSSSSSTSESSEDKVRAARLSRHSFTLPHYYHGYPIPFNTGHSGNIQNVALNTSQVHGMHLENTQHPNFANMFYPQTPFPIPFQLPVHSFQAANSNILANSTSSTVTEESRGSYTQNPQSPGRWGGLNTLVNVATHFADTDPKQS